MRTGRSFDEIVERRRRERDLGGERFVDLRLDFELDGQELLSVGGRWDRRADGFDGDGDRAVVIRIHPGQRRAVEWFAAWLEVHAGRRDNPPDLEADATELELDTDPAHSFSALFAGGRRAGKTFAAVGLAVAYAVKFPGAIVWLVSPSNEKHDEIRSYVASFAPRAWLDGENADGWELCNGSRLLLKSAYGTGEGLKEGKAHLVLLNEAQMMASRAYVVSRGAIVDSSGLVLVCANPPVEAKDQQWVADFAADAAAGKRAAVYLHFNPLLNPHINRRSLLALKEEVDDRTFQVEVLGMFLAAKNAVAYNWVRVENERRVPDEKHDCTMQFLSTIGEGDGIRQVIGLDVQRFPYIGGPIFKFFGDPDRDRVFAWIVGEVVLPGGDEVDFCEELKARGLKPEETLIVCDASGRYQHSRRRTTDEPPVEWTGRGSFSLIQGEGFTRIVVPDRRMKKNPDIVDRVRAFTSMIATGTGVRRLFADPELAPKTCAAIREWRTHRGSPSRSQEVAHLGDGASYPIIRLFPRRLRSSGRAGRVPDPIAARVDLPTAASLPPSSPPPARQAAADRAWTDATRTTASAIPGTLPPSRSSPTRMARSERQTRTAKRYGGY